MGILPSPPRVKTVPQKKKGPQIDFASLTPLTSTGTKNFAGYREPVRSPTSAQKKSGKHAADDNAMDSDADDEEYYAPVAEDANDADITQEPAGMLSAEDALRQGELAEGVRKIKVRSLHDCPYLVVHYERHKPSSWI